MTSVKVGETAPAFKGRDQEGNLRSLEDFKGKKLVIYFYPEDDTPTCTDQACNLRDNYALLLAKGYAVVGISPDTVESHNRFAQKFSLPFPLIADPEHQIINRYGVWGEKNMYGRKYDGLHRTTILVDEAGIIRKIFLKPRSKQHSEEIIRAWESL